MAQSNLTPPELHDGRSDRAETFKLINWLRRRAIGGSSAGLIGAVLSFDSISVSGTNRLDAFNFAGYANGTECWVSTVGDYFYLDTDGGHAADGITIVAAATPVGAQLVRINTPNRASWAVTSWFVDPANSSGTASDENNGLALASPLRTFAEFGRRVNGAHYSRASIAVTQMSSAPSTDPLVLTGIVTSGITIMTVTGTPTVVASGRTISAATNPASQSSNAYYSLTDASAVFTPWLQACLLHRTSGTEAWFWGYRDLGAGVLQVSPPTTASLSLSTLAASDVYEVLSLPTFANLVMTGCGRFFGVTLSKLKITGSSINSTVTGAGFLTIDRCLLGGSFPTLSGDAVDSVGLNNCCLPATAGGMSVAGWWLSFSGLYAGNGTSTALTTTEGYLLGGNASNVITLGGIRLDVLHYAAAERISVMSYDWTGTIPVLLVTHESQLQLDNLGGARNTGPLLGVGTFSRAMSTTSFATWNAASTTHPTPYSVDGVAYAAALLGSATNHVATRGAGILDIGGTWTNDLSGVGTNPSVIGFHETSGPTQLLYGAVADGQFLRRSGTTVIGDTPPAGTVTAVTATTPLSSSGGTTPNITHDNSALGPGAHGGSGIAAFTTDAQGHVTAVTAATYQTAGSYITALTGDVTATGPGAVSATISSHAVTNAKFRQSAAVSLVGNSTAGVADVQDITLGAGLSFSGTTLVSTGSGGTVTSVTATLPLTSTGGTTPVIALNYDNVTITLSGAAGTPIQRAALTGVITASAGSNATAFASAPAVSVLANATGAGASPGYFVAASSGDVLWRNGAGLSWSHIPVASVTGAQATITWPSSPQVLYSNGTGSDPVGDANITIDTATHQLRIIGTNGNQAFYNLLSGGDFERTIFYWTADVFTVEQQAGGTGTVRGMQITSALGLNAGPDSVSASYVLTAAPSATRDRIWLGVGGVTATDGVNREYVTISPAATTVSTNNLAFATTFRVRGASYTTSGVSLSLATGIYVDQPLIDGNVSSPGYQAYAIYAGGGTGSQSKFEGVVITDSATISSTFQVGAGVHIIDSTGIKFFNSGAAVGVAQQTVTGSRGGNAALTSLLAAGSAYGLWIDGTTP